MSKRIPNAASRSDEPERLKKLRV
ncbi:hypothetical protein YPPY11_2685, partial [Yersinia pestis PY-11]